MLQEEFLRFFFRLAAAYNMAWAVALVLSPNLFFKLLSLPPINYPFVMFDLGLGVGLLGYGYWVVAQDLRRYPQLVVIGFLSKMLGPIASVWAVMTNILPARALWANVLNDLVWLPFFVAYFVWYRRKAGGNSGPS